MARPLRFRFHPGEWTPARIRSALLSDLEANLGASMRSSWFAPPEDYEAVRFEMDNGDTALFCYRPGRVGTHGDPPIGGGFWIGNTETPSALWRTEKYDFAAVPPAIAEWAERELLAELHEAEPWLASYPAISWFFLPVLCSKDGRETTRRYFREHAGGFPDAERETGLGFYEEFLATGALDEYREVMAGKLGTSTSLDRTRMDAAMTEFTVAWLLHRAEYTITPEVEVSTGHSIDFRAGDGEGATLVEVTRPLPPDRRSADTGPAALRDTASAKAAGQLANHGGGITLFVDCSGFDDETWANVLDVQPEVHHRPAIVFRVTPDGSVDGYRLGSVPLDLDSVIAWRD